MPQYQSHTYEEIRDVVIDILLGKEAVQYEASQFQNLKSGVHEVFLRRSGHREPGQPTQSSQDAELIRDVFWDLFRQGAITLGMDNSNLSWPFFRLSHFGKRTLAGQSPWRFHDTCSYMDMVHHQVPDLSNRTAVYLEEAVTAFYAQCLLASCVMLGVAAEEEFLRLLNVAVDRPTVGSIFQQAAKERNFSYKINKFLPALAKISSSLNGKVAEDIEKNFSPIQSVLRIARNEAAHSSFSSPQRENVYVHLQLFIPFARQLFRIRNALIEHDPDTSSGGL